MSGNVRMSEVERGMECDAVTVPVAVERTKVERNRVWREENRAALEAYAEEVAREGVPLASFRTF